MFIRGDRELTEQMRRKLSQKARQQLQMGMPGSPRSPQHLVQGIAKAGPSPPLVRRVFDFDAPMLMAAFPVGNRELELATLLQPVPINNNGMRCYSQKQDIDDDEESMGTIEGQILDEEGYIVSESNATIHIAEAPVAI